MMTGNQSIQTLHALHHCSGDDFLSNLAHLTHTITTLPNHSFIVAPEVAITNFAYEQFEAAAALVPTIDETLLQASHQKTIITTMIQKVHNDFYNIAKCYHNGALVHTQAKHKLFTLGKETKHFRAAELEPTLFEIDGIKIGLLICFELRFTQYWQTLKGADIIVIPAQWGKIRSDHFQTLSKALAITNQCYVIACDSANEDCTNYQAVITPFGEQHLLSAVYDPKVIKKMRKYLDVGLNG